MIEKIAVVDLDSIIFAIFNGVKLLDEQGNPIKVLSKSGNMVFSYRDKTEDELRASADFYMNQILTQGGFTHYIGFVKGKDTTKYRLQVNPDYKANRPSESPKFWEFVKNDLITRWNAVEVNGMEVDDAVNITRLNLSNSYITAIDGDLLNLEGDHYNWRKNEWVLITEYQAQYKFWKDMVIGQPGDNIKGLPGKGDKYWDKMYPFGCTALRQSIFTDYCLLLGEYQGVKEFYKNYISLKILEYYPDFVLPQPIPIPVIKTNIEHLFE